MHCGECSRRCQFDCCVVLQPVHKKPIWCDTDGAFFPDNPPFIRFHFSIVQFLRRAGGVGYESIEADSIDFLLGIYQDEPADSEKSPRKFTHPYHLSFHLVVP